MRRQQLPMDAASVRALSDAARTLRDELGIEPSRELRDLGLL
jgi:DNA-binding SARP family transcriptional activator